MSAQADDAIGGFLQSALSQLAGERGYAPLTPQVLTPPPLSGHFPLVMSRGRQSGMALDIHLVAFCPADGLTQGQLETRLDALTELVQRIGEQGNVDAQRGGRGRQVQALLLWVYRVPADAVATQAAAALHREVRGSRFGRWPVDSAVISLAEERVWLPGGPQPWGGRGRLRAGLARELLTGWQRQAALAGPADKGTLAEAQQRWATLGHSLQAGATPVSYGLLVLIGLFFLLLELSGGATNSRTLVRFGALVPQLVAQGQWWRLVSAAFLHIGLTHLLFNAWALYLYGPLVERLFGPWRFAAIYLIAAIAGNLLSLDLGNGISAGASGAIFGLLGATISLALRRGRSFPAGLRDSLLRNAIAIVAINVVISLTVPGINLFAHGGGFLAGAVTGALFRPRAIVAARPQGPLGVVISIAVTLLTLLALALDLAWGLGHPL